MNNEKLSSEDLEALTRLLEGHGHKVLPNVEISASPPPYGRIVGYIRKHVVSIIVSAGILMKIVLFPVDAEKAYRWYQPKIGYAYEQLLRTIESIEAQEQDPTSFDPTDIYLVALPSGQPAQPTTTATTAPPLPPPGPPPSANQFTGATIVAASGLPPEVRDSVIDGSDELPSYLL